MKTYLINNKIPFEENVSLKTKTWLKRGGLAKFWITPESKLQLLDAAIYLHNNHIDFIVVGHTSNMYFLDGCQVEVVISTRKLTSYEEIDGYIVCECGVHVQKISRECVAKGYCGFSGLVNLPGTVAAATINNSSCFDCDLSSLIESIEYFDLEDGQVRTLNYDDMNYGFRSSALKRKERRGIVLSITLKTIKGKIEEEKRKAQNATDIRHRTQEPPAYTLGSVYAGLSPTKSVKHKIAYMGGVIAEKLHILPKKKFQKEMLLLLYGYRGISKFVSDRNINTFIWLPDQENIQEKFAMYQDFISKAYESPRLEVELIGNR